jgi:hypothetical protein
LRLPSKLGASRVKRSAKEVEGLVGRWAAAAGRQDFLQGLKPDEGAGFVSDLKVRPPKDAGKR